MFFFAQVGNNASSCSSFNPVVIAYFSFDISLITTLAFNKVHVSSIRISTLHTCVLFIIFFSVFKPKGDLSDKIFIENELASNANQLTNS